jgi:hypothetical protein
MASYNYNYSSVSEGWFFPAILANPGRYLVRWTAEEVLFLGAVKERGWEPVLISNATAEFVVFALDYVAGDCNWRSLLHCNIAVAGKPAFFQPGNRTPFAVPKTRLPGPASSSEEVSNNRLPQPERLTLGTGHVYLHGNVTEFLKVCGAPAASPQVIYVGDHIRGDCAGAKDGCGWDTIAIVEELANEGVMDSVVTDLGAQGHYLEHWGSCFGCDRETWAGVMRPGPGGFGPQLTPGELTDQCALLVRTADLAVPSVIDLAHLVLNRIKQDEKGSDSD